MSNPVAQHEALLKQHQFRLVRQDKHRVYQNPDGKVYVTSSTPSDSRWAKNAISVLKRVVEQPAKPLTIAISDFERAQAEALIKPQPKEPGLGHTKQKSNGGTGFTYIDKKEKEIVSAIPPEQKLAEKIQHQWESTIRKARHEFVELIAAKLKRIHVKVAQDHDRQHQEFLDRFKYYADSPQLVRDVARTKKYIADRPKFCKQPKNDDCSCSWCRSNDGPYSELFYLIRNISSTQLPMSNNFDDQVQKCPACVKEEKELNGVPGTDVYLCRDHLFERTRVAALNADYIIKVQRNSSDHINTVIKTVKMLFNAAMNGDEEFWQQQDEDLSINNREPGDILHRFAIRKLKPIVQELFKQKPQSIMEAAA